MALRHAVLAALLDGEYSGYQLAKIFDLSVSNFWHAVPQQLYSELSRLETEGLISGRQIIQHDRPNKRVYTVTEAGVAELERFATTPPSRASSARTCSSWCRPWITSPRTPSSRSWRTGRWPPPPRSRSSSAP